MWGLETGWECGGLESGQQCIFFNYFFKESGIVSLGWECKFRKSGNMGLGWNAG